MVVLGVIRGIAVLVVTLWRALLLVLHCVMYVPLYYFIEAPRSSWLTRHLPALLQHPSLLGPGPAAVIVTGRNSAHGRQLAHFLGISGSGEEEVGEGEEELVQRPPMFATRATSQRCLALLEPVRALFCGCGSTGFETTSCTTTTTTTTTTAAGGRAVDCSLVEGCLAKQLGSSKRKKQQKQSLEALPGMRLHWSPSTGRPPVHDEVAQEQEHDEPTSPPVQVIVIVSPGITRGGPYGTLFRRLSAAIATLNENGAVEEDKPSTSYYAVCPSRIEASYSCSNNGNDKNFPTLGATTSAGVPSSPSAGATAEAELEEIDRRDAAAVMKHLTRSYSHTKRASSTKFVCIGFSTGATAWVEYCLDTGTNSGIDSLVIVGHGFSMNKHRGALAQSKLLRLAHSLWSLVLTRAGVARGVIPSNGGGIDGGKKKKKSGGKKKKSTIDGADDDADEGADVDEEQQLEDRPQSPVATSTTVVPCTTTISREHSRMKRRLAKSPSTQGMDMYFSIAQEVGATASGGSHVDGHADEEGLMMADTTEDELHDSTSHSGLVVSTSFGETPPVATAAMTTKKNSEKDTPLHSGGGTSPLATSDSSLVVPHETLDVAHLSSRPNKSATTDIPHHHQNHSTTTTTTTTTKKMSGKKGGLPSASAAGSGGVGVVDSSTFRSPTSRDVIRDLAIPTLVIHALDDDVVPPSSLPVAAMQGNDNIVLLTVPRGGHGFFFESLLQPLSPNDSSAQQQLQTAATAQQKGKKTFSLFTSFVLLPLRLVFRDRRSSPSMTTSSKPAPAPASWVERVIVQFVATSTNE